MANLADWADLIWLGRALHSYGYPMIQQLYSFANKILLTLEYGFILRYIRLAFKFGINFELG